MVSKCNKCWVFIIVLMITALPLNVEKGWSGNAQNSSVVVSGGDVALTQLSHIDVESQRPGDHVLCYSAITKEFFLVLVNGSQSTSGLLLYRSKDLLSWSKPMVLGRGANYYYYYSVSMVTFDNDRLGLAYDFGYGNQTAIVFSVLETLSGSFTKTNVADNTTNNLFPSLHYHSNGTLFLFFRNGTNLHMASSQNDGGDWSSPIQYLSQGGKVGQASFGESQDGALIGLATIRDQDWGLFMVQGLELLEFPLEGDFRDPSIASDGQGRYFFSWVDSKDGILSLFVGQGQEQDGKISVSHGTASTSDLRSPSLYFLNETLYLGAWNTSYGGYGLFKVDFIDQDPLQASLVGPFLGLVILSGLLVPLVLLLKRSKQKNNALAWNGMRRDLLYYLYGRIEAVLALDTRSLIVNENSSDITSFLPNISKRTKMTDFDETLVKDVKGLQLLILLDLADSTKHYMTFSTIQKQYGKSDSTVYDAINNLIELGFIEVDTILGDQINEDLRVKRKIITEEGINFLRVLSASIQEILSKQNYVRE